MSSRPATPSRTVRLVGFACVSVACVATIPCSARAQSLAVHHQAIVGGQAVQEPSPVMLMRGPTGLCSATLVAKRLVVTARHCVAQLASGPFSCTPEGETKQNGTSGGRMGEDWPAPDLTFFLAHHASSSLKKDPVPDAVGARIFSTETRTACRDDLAFVLLDRDIVDVAPARLRLDTETTLGERVGVLGYGLTGAVEPPTLHFRNDVEVLGVGAAVPSPFAGLAPVRSVRIASVTCAGDSGGPIVSDTTHAIVAVVSIGTWDNNQADDPYGPCVAEERGAASGPRIAAYPALVQRAFEAVDEVPALELAPMAALEDAGVEQTRERDSHPTPGCTVYAPTAARADRLSTLCLAMATLGLFSRSQRRRQER